jgi:photosystem II stability/assembly factor-like uncharacterized protein
MNEESLIGAARRRACLRGLVAASLAGCAVVAHPQESVPVPTIGSGEAFTKELRQQPAVATAWATHAAMLAVGQAGSRIVAVGDHGVVLLSDDGGRSFRQARQVPTRVTLTSVYFVDARTGWAAGHWGVVLKTGDAGESWTLQRQDTSVDQPLFSIFFTDPVNGIAVGLWSLALRTTDGGSTWATVKMPAAPEAGKSGPNLYQIFPLQGGGLMIAAELGLVMRSDDGGQNWSLVRTGNRGSLWTGLALSDGAILVAGLNGKVLRSSDSGKTWTALDSGTSSSITALAQGADGTVLGVGLEGASVMSKDGVHFTAAARPDRASLTAVLMTAQGSPLLFSKEGVVESN